jgi:plastocyanin
MRFTLGTAFIVAGVVACGGESATTPSSSSGGATTPSASSASGGTAGVNLGAAAESVSATDQLKFDPGSVSAHVGDIVKWTNTGTVNHTVTFESNPSLSDVSLAAGGTWEVKFDAAGTYAYRCTIHAGMTGTVTVS